MNADQHVSGYRFSLDTMSGSPALNLLRSSSLQDDGPAGGVPDPVLAALEVHPLPAEALEGVPTRAGHSQEGHKASAAAAQEGLE